MMTRWMDLSEDLKLPHECGMGIGCRAPFEPAPATWAAVSPAGTIYACSQHLGELLNPEFVWFVHPLEVSA